MKICQYLELKAHVFIIDKILPLHTKNVKDGNLVKLKILQD
jgi:hypothetical protein